LAELSKSKKKIYSTVDFFDIAGLVKGASQGEGLGNKFLSHIREVDAVLYVLRAFKKSDIINTQQEVNPLKEKGILDVELILKDLETVNKRVEGLEGDVRAGKKEAIKEMAALKKARDFLAQEKLLCDMVWEDEDALILKGLSLLTFKPRLYLLNGSESEVSNEVKNKLKDYVVVDVQSELEAEGMTSQERRELGLPELSETDILIKKSYQLLNLITFLTTGEDETRAWTIKKGDTAPEAGAVIHTDFQNKFVKAEVVFWNDLVDNNGYAGCREKGLVRTEGKEYIVQDGDVIEFKHG